MACGSAPYTLVGFAAELDWRPLHFVRPIPWARVCSACGLVRTKTALLPCMHVVCGSCYDQCAPDGELSCPLDDLHSPEEDVEWKEWTAEELLKREVKCWNEESGCTAVMAASEIFLHFQRHCQHHSARCPNCSALVLCSDVCAHLRSNCANLGVPTAPECTEHIVRSDGKHRLTNLERVLEEQTREMKAVLEQLLSESTAQGERLNEISHGQNAFTETLKSELSHATREIIASNEQIKQSTINNLSSRIGASEETLRGELVNVMAQNGDNFSRLATAIDFAKGEAEQYGRKILDSFGFVVTQSKLHVDRCEFFVSGVESLREKAEKEGYAKYESERVYLRGYCMSPGIVLKKHGGFLTLLLRFQVHRGDIDDVVLWPLEHRLRLNLVHPRKCEKAQVEVKPCRSERAPQRPLEQSNIAVFYRTPFLKFSDLARDGYVHEDQLRVIFELLQ